MSFEMWTPVGPRKHVLDGMRSSETWQIQQNRPRAAAMRPFVKLLWPLVVDCVAVSVSIAVVFTVTAQFLGDRLKNSSPYAIGPLSACQSVCLVMLVYCGQTAGWINMPLGTRYRPRPRWQCVRRGPSSPPRKGVQQPSLFGPCMWPNGRPSQQLFLLKLKSTVAVWPITATSLLQVELNACSLKFQEVLSTLAAVFSRVFHARILSQPASVSARSVTVMKLISAACCRASSKFCYSFTSTRGSLCLAASFLLRRSKVTYSHRLCFRHVTHVRSGIGSPHKTTIIASPSASSAHRRLPEHTTYTVSQKRIPPNHWR